MLSDAKQIAIIISLIKNGNMTKSRINKRMKILIVILLLFIATGTMTNTIYLRRIAKKLGVDSIADIWKQ